MHLSLAIAAILLAAPAGDGAPFVPTHSITLVGYQLRFSPEGVFVLGRVPGTQSTPSTASAPASPLDTVLVAIEGKVLKNAVITPGVKTSATSFTPKAAPSVRGVELGKGGTEIHWGADVHSISELGVAAPGPASQGWSIETSSYSIQWPIGFTVNSTIATSKWPFELTGFGARAGEMIILRGPMRGRQVPSPPALVGDGQSVVGQDLDGRTPWVELKYIEDGKPWRQRHIYTFLDPETVVLVTAQAPEAQAAEVFKSATEVAQSVHSTQQH